MSNVLRTLVHLLQAAQGLGKSIILFALPRLKRRLQLHTQSK